jgi:hypothetical protein
MVFAGTYSLTNWINVQWLHLNGSGAIAHSDLENIANSAATAWGDNVVQLLSENCLLSYCQLVLYADGDVTDAIATAGIAGAASGSALPASVSCCISWRIASHYRGGHPRTYLPGLNQEMMANVKTWDGGFRTSVANGATAFHTAIESLSGITNVSSIDHGTMSFVDAGDWRDPPVFRRFSGDVVVDSRIDTQRRRLGPDVIS